MTPSKILFYFCITFVVGVGAAYAIKIPQLLVWGFLVLGVLIVAGSLIFKNRQLGIFGFCIFFLLLGIARLYITEFNIDQDSIRKLNDKPDKITLMGQVIDGSDVRDKYQKLKIEIEGTGSVVLVSTGRYPEYHYLDTLKITGKLVTPAITEDFNYKNYLLKDGIYSVMDFPKIEIIFHEHHYNAISFLYNKLLWFKGKLTKSIDQIFSSSDGALVEGVILGGSKGMTQEEQNALNATGVRHLTAVSGGNIVILINILTDSLLFLGLSRGKALWASGISIWIYIVLIGFGASGVRAAIMGSIALLAQILGRKNTGIRTIVIAATLMVLQNPLLLMLDVGFQLSFLASLGIITLKPIIDTFWHVDMDKTVFNNLPKNYKEFTEKTLRYFWDIVAVTLCAQLFTLPILMYNFGIVSLVAPLTNLLVLPIIPWLMTVGFLSAFFGMFSNFLGWAFYLPSWVLLRYFFGVIHTFYQPWATVTTKNVPWIFMVTYYVLLTMLVKFLERRQKPKFLGY